MRHHAVGLTFWLQCRLPFSS